MDGLDLFRKLGVGAKFNFNRFQKDAEKLQLKRKVANLPEFEKEVDEQDLEGGGAPDRAPAVKRQRDEEASSDDGSVETEADEEQELYLLGSMKSRTTVDEDSSDVKIKRKKRKKKKVAEKLQAELSQERVNQFRNKYKIHTYGTDVPDPISSFVDLQKVYKIQSIVMTNVNSLGFENPTPIQMQAVPVMMNHREILACAPTGSGKTLAFILPILHHLQCPQNKGFRALVLSPTRELATQTHREFTRLAEGTGFRVHIIEKSTNAQKKFGPQTKQNFDILITTPNRLVHLLRQDPPHVSLSNVEWLVVDESDKLFEDGKTGFRDQIAAIYQACDGNNVRRAMFSATFAHEVEEWCKLNLDSLVQVYIGTTNSATETVKQELVFVGSESGKLLAVQDMVRKGLQPPVLVFVQSKDRAKELFHELIYDGINVDVIHADRTQTQRDNIIKQFRAGNIWILICTELMGRGIDFKGVNLVINYDFPTSAVSYIHRIGRTGRAGMSGTAITFFTENDVPNLRSIANVMKGAGCPVPEYMLRLKKTERRQRRKMAKSNPKRASIRTIPKRDILQAKKRNKMKKKVHTDPAQN